jgi:hypothetical protein
MRASRDKVSAKKWPEIETPDQLGEIKAFAPDSVTAQSEEQAGQWQQPERQREELTFSDFIDAQIGKESDRD